jgi:hypothetical protein
MHTVYADLYKIPRSGERRAHQPDELGPTRKARAIPDNRESRLIMVAGIGGPMIYYERLVL